MATVSLDGTRKSNSSAKLDDQAAKAALFVTNQDRNSKTGHRASPSDSKLSSAGAASSLKYAKPQDLPSFPSAGSTSSAAGAAANIGWANQKPFETWKPDPSASASAAAMVAKDYKMVPLWQPEQSSSGAKAAALAHKDGGKVETWKPKANPWGSTAANQAFQRDRDRDKCLSPPIEYDHTAVGSRGSLLAATGAMSGSRRRAESSPIPAPKLDTYPDESNAIANALSAATSASKPRKSNVVHPEGGSVPYTTLPREMFTSHPPVPSEVEHQHKADILRASAVAMAKQMYNQQQKQNDSSLEAQQGAIAAGGASLTPSTSREEVQPMRFNSLQEAAQKLAQERLAKLHDEHAKNREYRDYYGSSPKPPSRLSIRGKPRRRASSDGSLDADKQQSKAIRAQMSIFSSNLSQVDEKKRQKDREALIAAAQRNVAKNLHGIDEKIFTDKGKIPPSLANEWELKAHAAAKAKSDNRMENYGKVDLGGGKFMNQSAIDLVATRNIQPVLDEINLKAEQERARQAQLKEEQETKQREASEKLTREKETKETARKQKQQDKEDEKTRKNEEKAAAVDKKRAAKEKCKSSGQKSEVAEAFTAAGAATAMGAAAATGAAPATGAATATEVVSGDVPSTTAEHPEVSSAPEPTRASVDEPASNNMAVNTDVTNPDGSAPASPSSPVESGSKVKNWLKTKFSRRLSKSQKSPEANSDAKVADGEKAFVGGAALTNANNGTAGLGEPSSLTPGAPLADTSKDEEPEVKPEAKPEGQPEESEDKAEDKAEEKAEGKPEDKSEEKPEETSEEKPEETSEEKPEEKQEEKPKELGESKDSEAPAAPPVPEKIPEGGARPDSGVSALTDESAGEDEDVFQEARDNFAEGLSPPPNIRAANPTAPARDSKFHEVI